MLIRPEASADHAAIRSVLEGAFPSPGEARLVDALREAGNLSASWVAEVDGEVVGHVAFSPVTLEGATDGLGLAPVAVRDDQRRRGVAASLIRTALEACAKGKVAFVVVLGDPAYYGRFGFRPASDHDLRDEYGGGAAFQVLTLGDGALPPGGGLVRYATEFGLVE